MAMNRFLEHEVLSESDTFTECKGCPNMDAVNLIIDSLFYREQHFITMGLSILSWNIRNPNTHYTAFKYRTGKCL